MAEAKSIEFLSVAFTVGVMAGTLMPAPLAPGLSALLLPLLALPLLFRDKVAQKPGAGALAGVLFLLTGVFCALCSTAPDLTGPSALERQAQGAAEGLRRFIGTLPFPSGETAPLLKALLTGDRSGLGADTVSTFRRSGASHLLALSGLHMGIIYLIFDRLTWVMGQRPAARCLRYGLLLGGAGFFTLMCGAGPSLVRAFLFIGINETLRLLGRPRKGVRVLCLALLLQLVLKPSAIGELGFQLSYLAMAGIFLLYPLLEHWYPEGSRFNPLRRIWQASALSISCQVFTAPLVRHHFHTFPRYFLLTNLLAIPVTSALMGMALCTLALSAMGWCPEMMYQGTDWLCRLLLGILETIGSL